MKKIIIAALSLCFVISASAFAPKKKTKTVLNPKIEKNFVQEFGNLENVEWSEAPNDLVKGTFKVEDQAVEAYFDADGNYVCSTSPIAKENLSIKLRSALAKKLGNTGINAIIEVNSASDGVAYYVQSTDTNGTKVWKCRADGSIEFFKKL